MSRSIVTFWLAHHDPWLDNALEVLYTLTSDLQRQFPEIVTAQLEADGLKLTICDQERFLQLLDECIARWIEKYLYYFTGSKAGERRQVMKQFVGFNQQPPKQRPTLYLAEHRRELLQQIFMPSDSKTKRRGSPTTCVLCGQVASGDLEGLTLSVYPFVTKIKSLSGIRTRWFGGSLRGFTDYFQACPRCYFLGALEWGDSGLLYRTGIGRRPGKQGSPGKAIVCLPFPRSPNLLALHQQKSGYRNNLATTEGRSNVRVRITRRDQEQDDFPPATYTLLLAFYERLLDIIAEQVAVGEDLFGEVRRRVPDGWVILSVPQGRMKNITAHELLLEQSAIRFLKDLIIEANVRPYQEVLALLWLADDEGKSIRDPDTLVELKEEMAAAILLNDFERFVKPFLPKPRRRLAFSWGKEGVEGKLERLIQIWRWKDMNPEQLETVKKAGRGLALIADSKRQAAMIYNLERVRTASDLLETLKEASHRLIGMEVGELKYISLDSLEQFTELVHQAGGDSQQFADLKNTLAIFAGIEYAKKTLRKGGEI